MLNKLEHSNVLATIKRGHVLEVYAANYIIEEEDYYVNTYLRRKTLVLVKKVNKIVIDSGRKWDKYKFTVITLNSKLEITFTCSKSDWLHEHHTNGENWELLYG